MYSSLLLNGGVVKKFLSLIKKIVSNKVTAKVIALKMNDMAEIWCKGFSFCHVCH